MSTEAIPFLWLCGPSGVGKSTVGWEVFSQLSRAGVKTAYLDLDQLGLCYPEPTDDSGNHNVKARNLGAVWPIFRAAGARCLVVSGGIDTLDGVRAYVDLVPGTALTLCRLRVSHDELMNRFYRRGWLTHLAAEARLEADALDRSDFADLCIDTDGVSVPDVARLVRERAGGWPSLAHQSSDPITAASPASYAPAQATGAVPLLWLCGPPGVGKSTVGWEIFTQVIRAGVKAAYVDLSQVGFCRPAPDDDPDNHRVKALNLGAMWPTFRSAGARCLIISGDVVDRDVIRRYADAVPGTVLVVSRLRAGRDQLTERILLRGRGGGPAIPGDELKGQRPEDLRRRAAEAARVADELDRAEMADVRVDTDGRSVEDVARLVCARAGGWPVL